VKCFALSSTTSAAVATVVQQFSRLIRQVLPLCDHAILRALEDALLFERFAHSTPDEQLNVRCLNKNAPDGDSVSTDDIVIVIAVSAGASRLSLSE